MNSLANGSTTGAALTAWARRHAIFGVAMLLALALRVVATVAYQGVLWFPDSRSYVEMAVQPRPYPARPQGYSLFLHLLEPLHSLLAIAIIQHLLGLASAVLIYALLRRRFALPGWGATLVTLPLLFDAYQIQLEHLLLSDELFMFFLIATIVLLLWKPRSVTAAVLVGLLIGLAAITRSVALPLPVLVGVYLLARRVGWRVFVATACACAVPVIGYAIWFHATWGNYQLTNSEGVFLYSRTTTFVDCDRVGPPPEEAGLCPQAKPGHRHAAPDYVWHLGELGRIASTNEKFSRAHNRQAQSFALRAIRDQPADYLQVSLDDLERTFEWNRYHYPSQYATRHYLFPDRAHLTYPGLKSPVKYVSLEISPRHERMIHSYARSNGRPTFTPGPAAFMRSYQRIVYMRGSMFGVVLLGGAVAICARGPRRWRRLGAPACLAWLTSAMLILVPPFTAAFDYRYVLPAVPLAGLAVGVALASDPRVRPTGAALRRLLANPSDQGHRVAVVTRRPRQMVALLRR